MPSAFAREITPASSSTTVPTASSNSEQAGASAAKLERSDVIKSLLVGAATSGTAAPIALPKLSAMRFTDAAVASRMGAG